MSVGDRVKVIEVSPELLRESAAAARHAGTQAWIHMEAEFAGDIDRLMETLVDKEPYAYTIMPQVSPEGAVRSPVMTTFEQVRDCYKLVRGRSDLLRVEPLVEIKGSFYVFHNNISYGRIRETGYENPHGSETLAIFPVSSGIGITGELVWANMPRDRLGAGPAPEGGLLEGKAARRENLVQHEAYLEALRANDVESVLATMNDGVQANIRDFVTDSGALVAANGKDAYRAYLDAFFARYEVLSAEHLTRLVEDWYVFAEVRMELRETMSGRHVAWNSAEFFVPAKDNRFIVQTGHATDPA
jgi:hypothetical protein